MSRDYKRAGEHSLIGNHVTATNPFNLPLRSAYQWEDRRGRASEQLHESAMYQLSFPRGTNESTSDAPPVNSLEKINQKWDDRGQLIQRHERRLRDSNNLLAKMWRRLDPHGRIIDALANDPIVQRHAERHAEPAYSENPYMQSLFMRLAAYDYVHAIDPSYPMQPVSSASTSDPLRVSNLATTIKMQSGLLLEKNDTIDKLREQLRAQRDMHTKFMAHQKDKDDLITGLERQLQKASQKISSLNNAQKLPSMQQDKDNQISSLEWRLMKANDRISVLSNAQSGSKSKSKSRALRPSHPSAPTPPVTTFTGGPSNHNSLTFNGFSERNAMNPARIQMLTDVNPPVGSSAADRLMSMAEDDLFRASPQSGANSAPLGPLKKKRYDSVAQSPRGSGASTPTTARGPSAVKTGKRDTLAFGQASNVGSKRDVSFLDYDDPEDVSKDTSRDSVKRLKSGVLTPPPPEDLLISASGDVSIIDEDVDLAIGEMKEMDIPARSGSNHKYVYDELDEMINQAQKDAMA